MRQHSQRGVVLIMVLWTAVVLTVLVTVLASNIRLSANTALHHRTGTLAHAELMGAVRKAEMELMMESMPLPLGVMDNIDDDELQRIPAYRFNGQLLNLHYPVEEHVRVRILDHAGKVNLNRIQRASLQQIIEKQLGGEDADPRLVQALLAAWSDWTDLNDVPDSLGAEDEYYLDQDPPYTTRNNAELDSVGELRLIRGFDELFGDLNLEAAFTIYGNSSVVNPNLATREALMLLPGMTAEAVEAIFALREQRDISTIAELGEWIPLEVMVEISPWLGLNTSSFFSIYAYTEQAGDQPATQAFMQVIEVRSFSSLPRVYMVHPYAQLPDYSPPGVDIGLLPPRD
jgi:general secretion pathway protein K